MNMESKYFRPIAYSILAVVLGMFWFSFAKLMGWL